MKRFNLLLAVALLSASALPAIAITPLTDVHMSGSGNQVVSGATLTIMSGGTLTIAGGGTLTGTQPVNANLTAWAGLASAANKLPYWTGSGTASQVDFSSFSQSLMPLSGRTAWLDAIAPSAPTTGDMLQYDGSHWVKVSGLTAVPFITQSASSVLSAEQSLGALTTGLLKNTVISSTGTLSTAVAGTDYVAPVAATSSGLTMATARILGRTTAGTGAIEEIPIGSGLTFIGGVLDSAGGSGDVVGPSSATDNALVRFDGTTGKLVQDSNVTLADSGTEFVFSGAGGITAASNTALTLTTSGTGYTAVPGKFYTGNGIDPAGAARAFNLMGSNASLNITRFGSVGSRSASMEFVSRSTSTGTDLAYWDIYVNSDSNSTDDLTIRSRTSTNDDVLRMTKTVLNVLPTTASSSTTTGALVVSGGVGIAGATFAADSISIATAGKGLNIKEGSNARMGVSTLVAGTVTVSTTAVTANSRIFLTGQNSSGTAGELSISARTAGTSFTVTSSSGSDTRDVAWVIFEPSS